MRQNHSHTPPEAATRQSDEGNHAKHGSSAAPPVFPATENLDEAEAAAPPPAYRHDGFTPKRRRKFLKTLRKTGCVRDACRKARLSDTAAYKLRRRDPEFAALWAAALHKAGTDFELLAYQRAVDGVEEEVFAYGKVVGTRRKRDSNLFRMLLQASNPARYGGQGYGSRKALEKEIRKKIAAEQEQAFASADEEEEAREGLVRRVMRLRERMIDEGKLVRDEEGNVTQPGYRLVRDPEAGAFGGEHEEDEDDEADENWPHHRTPGPAAAADRPEPEPFRPDSAAAAGRGSAAPPEGDVRAGPRITTF